MDSERYLLYSAADQNNERDRRGVALTLNHELAHQWSGNLVTCDWWTMAWLNEGYINRSRTLIAFIFA
jgi:aminopeptidase N